MDPIQPAITGQLETPQSVDATPSALCSAGHTPLIITGSILWVLRRHFALASNIKEPQIKQYIWHSETTQSKIMIEPATSWTKQAIQTMQRRPAVLVRREPWQVHKMGFGDQYQGEYNAVDSGTSLVNNVLDVGTRYETLLQGSHTVLCLGGVGSEVEALASEVFFELLEFQQVIREDLHLNKFETQQMGRVTKVEESQEHWVVPITVQYVANHAWTITEEGRPLKTAVIQVGV